MTLNAIRHVKPYYLLGGVGAEGGDSLDPGSLSGIT